MRILIAFDGSTSAEQSLGLADSIDWPVDSTLRVATVVEPALYVGGPLAGGMDVPQPNAEDTIAYQQEVVTTAADKVRSAERTVEGVVLRGRPASALVEEARQFRADLLMAGSRGRGSISSLLLGSVSAELVDDAPCPVLVSRTPSINHVIFATDGSVYSMAAEDVLSTWQIFERMPIDVVSVADVVKPWHTGVAPTMYRQVLEAHAKDLSEARSEHARIAGEATARLTTRGRQAHAAPRTGDAAAEIIAAATELGGDLVVMGSRGQTGLSRVLLGSVARNVIQGSTTSVLVVHAPRSSNDPTS